MLTLLKIENFALIDSLELEFGPGLTVISGETGAGKSIILAAMGLILGQRAASDLIRQEREQAVVEALFEVEPDGPAAAFLEEPGELLLSRVVNRSGKNRVKQNGGLATLNQLALLGPSLVSLVGQHSSQALLDPEEHLTLLDDFAGLGGLLEKVAGAVEGVREVDREINRLSRSLAQREERRILLEAVVAELSTAGLDPREEADLKQEREILANAGQIARLAEGAHQGLYAADGSVLEVLGRIRGLLTDLARLDPRMKEAAARLEESYYTLEDLAGEMRDYASGLVFDPGRQDWVEGRLLELQRLTRKYGGDAEAALKRLEEAQAELNTLAGGEDRLREMDKARQTAVDAALELAGELSARRREAAQSLARAVEAEVHELGMAACQVEVRFGEPAGPGVETPRGPLTSLGLESAELYLAPNPGEGFRRLARIASGGELSRLLLALRSVVARRRGAPTLVFDEVDAGIGGATGSAVGKKLYALGRDSQVICITHLPQIAAWGDRHLAVRKEVKDGRTQSVLIPLEPPQRLQELARMLGGPMGQDAAREHATALLEGVGREKAAAAAAPLFGGKVTQPER